MSEASEHNKGFFAKVLPFRNKSVGTPVSMNNGEIVLCKEDQEAFAAALRNPPAPGPQLVAAYKGYKDRVGG